MSTYMTTAEVAEVVRTPVETVRFWRHVGKGPKSFKVGRRVLYATEDVEAWLEGARNGGETDLRETGAVSIKCPRCDGPISLTLRVEQVTVEYVAETRVATWQAFGRTSHRCPVGTPDLSIPWSDFRG